MTSYTFALNYGGDMYVSAQMIGGSTPPDGGIAYHISMTARDLAGPSAVSYSGSVDGAIRIDFDEEMTLGSSGRIELRDAYNTVFDSWNIGDPRIHVAGKTLILDAGHPNILMPGRYDIITLGYIMKDALGNWREPGTSMGIDLNRTAAGGLAVQGIGGGNVVRSGSASSEDVVVYDGKRSSYEIMRGADGYTVRHLSGTSGDILKNIEQVRFTDSHDAVALSLDGHLGQAYRLYKAAFDRAPDEIGLGFWLHSADVGVGIAAMARGFLDSEEFVSRNGAHPDDDAFVATLYRNVLHRAGDQGGVDFWTHALAGGADHAEVLAQFSESAENQAQVAELVGNGIVFTPYG